MSSSPLATAQELRQFFKSCQYDQDVLFEKQNILGYRCKVKLAVRGSKKNPMIGIFEQGTHRVVDLCDCKAHHEHIQTFLKSFKDLLKTCKIEPYDEKTGQGTLRYVQLFLNDSSELGVVLVVQHVSDQVEKLVDELKTLGIASVWLNIQSAFTNTIFSKEWQHASGKKFLMQNVLGKKIYFHPGAFCQNNLNFFEKILDEISQYLDVHAKGLDLYSGVGLFGLTLKEHFKDLIFAESNPFAKEAFDESLKANLCKGCEFFTGDAKDALERNLDADVVFVDPPRKGLEKQIKPLLSHLKPGSMLVYVSCGYMSLKRDIKELLDLGFTLNHVKIYDCFPGTPEVETLCILQKRF